MRSAFAVKIFAAALPSIVLLPTLSMPTTAFGSIAADTDRAEALFREAARELAVVQKRLGEIDRAQATRLYDDTLADYKRVLDRLSPIVTQLNIDVPAEKTLRDQYAQWLSQYQSALGLGDAGRFQIAMNDLWNYLTSRTHGWMDEKPHLTFARILEKPDDPSNRLLGMPKTAELSRAATRYMQIVQEREEYQRFKDLNNIRNDLRQTEKARDEAQQKLVEAASAILVDAGGHTLDDNSRDVLSRFIEQDLRDSLTGSAEQEELLSRGRKMVSAYDEKHGGIDTARSRAKERLLKASDEAWPQIEARYADKPLDPLRSSRGQMVQFAGAWNELGSDFRSNEFDFATRVNGMPVVAKYHPTIKKHIENVKGEIGADQLPTEEYRFVGVVRGLGKISAIQHPNTSAATTNPALDATSNQSVATPPTGPRLETTDCVVIDVLAVKAGPACFGVDPTVDQMAQSKLSTPANRAPAQGGVAAAGTAQNDGSNNNGNRPTLIPDSYGYGYDYDLDNLLSSTPAGASSGGTGRMGPINDATVGANETRRGPGSGLAPGTSAGSTSGSGAGTPPGGNTGQPNSGTDSNTGNNPSASGGND